MFDIVVVGHTRKKHTNFKVHKRISGNYINVEWSPIEDGHTLIKIKKKDIKFEGQIREFHFISVLKNKTRVIVLRNNLYLDGIKRFLKEVILDEFYFIEPTG